MTLAIGDIHGCHISLQTMLDLVQPTADDLVITLGDYVDRGPDSKKVIKILLELKKTHHYIHLMGNHEIQMIRALEAPHHMTRFLDPLCGGQEDHWNFITSAELYHETDSHIFVHAGVSESTPMQDQDPETLYYKRFYQGKPHISGKPYICGHTIQGDLPTNNGHAICLDTCAYGGGWLTALDTDTGRCYQTNEQGQSREIDI